jgi:uncharacterized membrane protein YpjA
MLIDRFFELLRQSWFLWLLIAVNFLGSIYGFYWYSLQLELTSPGWLKLFVPDSPTGSLLFTFFLLALVSARSFPHLEAFACVTNFKYGVWAVVVIVSGWFMGQESRPTDYMLMFSHAGMAVESLLYYRFYTFKWQHLLLVAVWTVSNDILDYTLDIHPWLPAPLNPYEWGIGIFTFLLSIFSLALFAFLVMLKRKMV